jgi:N-acetyl-anhydromuramyl-L-alanine amidase AmpD
VTTHVTKRLLSINHSKGRRGMTPDQIVLHVTEGSAASVRSWFASPLAQVSAHYLVTIDGAVEQYVEETDTAWHCGRVERPTAPLVHQRPQVNPNLYSIGIEHEGTGTEPMTPPQLASSLSLVTEICARWKIPMDCVHVVGHREIFAEKSCPGAIDVDAYVRALRMIAAPPPTSRPLVVWSAFTSDWLLVTQVVSNEEWLYVPMSAIRRGIVPTRATTPLSKMPLVAP